MAQRPKKNMNKFRLDSDIYGNTQRRVHAEKIVEDAPVFPKPLEYKDIDDAMFDFVENTLDLTMSGKKVPTFRLFSGQRFSEYSQTWKHTDSDNNLLMNFKTVSRSPNPDPGENQGKNWNIPGDRRYTILVRDVMEDDGKEVREVYSMKQPYAVNMSYRISFMTNEFDNLNQFNSKLNELFKSRQFYITVNGHYTPLILDDISDETRYGVEEQKFFAQTATIKVMAYIIHESDFKVERIPKEVRLGYMGEKRRKKPQVNIDEFENEHYQHTSLDVEIKFNAWDDKAEFIIDTDMVIEETETENVRSLRLFVNKEPIYHDRGFSVKENDSITVKIFPLRQTSESRVVLHGYNPNSVTDASDPEFNIDESYGHEYIEVL